MAEQKSFAENLFGKLDKAEMILLLALTTGVVLHFSGISQAPSLIIVSLGGLAAIFFLKAFRPPADRTPAEGEKADFLGLFFDVVLPKVLWISSAICASSLMLYHMDTGNEGYKQGLMIHAAITAVGIVALGFAALKGLKNLQAILPIFYRAIPLLLAAIKLLQS